MNCHGESGEEVSGSEPLVILAGQPNVGKSVLFKHLTGRYVTVSNYPGTTVEVSQGRALFDGQLVVVDAPGINSLQPLADDERVTRKLLLSKHPRAVVQVADAKNLARALFLTVQFAELQVPLVLDLNMADEAAQRGVSIDYDALARILGIAVVPTVATSGQGVKELISNLGKASVPGLKVVYDTSIESAVRSVERLLPKNQVGTRGIALLLLSGDPELAREMLDTSGLQLLEAIRQSLQSLHSHPLSQVITQQRWQSVSTVVDRVYARQKNHKPSPGEVLGRLAIHPVWGWPIVALCLFLVYKFVGEFGAGTLVDFFQKTVFGKWITPGITSLVDSLVPIPFVHDFLVGDYGLISVGLAYGLGIVLPIVSTFFLAFGILEDSGYLPRLAALLNRAFKTIGLNGKAVLPMVLGLGCVTMATMTTRILTTRKERVMASLLLALSVPCSAQLGVIMAMVGWLSFWAVIVWAGVMVGVMLLVGWLASRVIPGESSEFIMELPPLRAPQLGNLLIKTLARLEWYLKEVIPLFLVATAALFVLARTGVLGAIEGVASPVVVGWLGLPPQTAGMFLVGFLRRDYGATGLFELARSGALNPHQILVSLVVVTLFVPCVATVMMMVKERGAKATIAIVSFVFPFAFLVGGIVHRLFGG